MDSFSFVIGLINQHGIVFLLAGIVVSQFFAIVGLSVLLFKKDKAIRLLKYSISFKGLVIDFDMDRDKKMKLLLDDNILMRAENEALKATIKENNMRHLLHITVIVVAFVVMLVWKKLMNSISKD